MDEHPDELRADFQQFYNLNIDGMGRDYSTLHAASLITQLPEGSRVASAYVPDSVWTTDRVLMAAMVNDLNWLVWSKTKDGSKSRNKPKQVGPNAGKGERRIRGEAMSPDDLMAAIERIRKGAHDA